MFLYLPLFLASSNVFAGYNQINSAIVVSPPDDTNQTLLIRIHTLGDIETANLDVRFSWDSGVTWSSDGSWADWQAMRGAADCIAFDLAADAAWGDDYDGIPAAFQADLCALVAAWPSPAVQTRWALHHGIAVPPVAEASGWSDDTESSAVWNAENQTDFDDKAEEVWGVNYSDLSPVWRSRLFQLFEIVES